MALADAGDSKEAGGLDCRVFGVMGIIAMAAGGGG